MLDAVVEFNSLGKIAKCDYEVKAIPELVKTIEKADFVKVEAKQTISEEENERWRKSRGEIPFTVQGILGNTRIEKGAVGDYEPLVLSLQSPFRNEHEFALNVCMILSAEETKELCVMKRTPAILSMLLAQVGFFGCLRLLSLVEEAHGLDLASFWERQLLPSQEDLDQLPCFDEPELLKQQQRFRESYINLIPRKPAAAAALPTSVPTAFPKTASGDAINLQASIYHTESNLLQVGRHVHRVGHILRNFSFQPSNAEVMARNPGLLRFLLVTAYSTFGSLSQISFDIISNIANAKFLVAEEETDDCQELNAMLMELIVSNLFYSNDRFKILRSMETIRTWLSGSMGLAEADCLKTRLIFEDESLYQRVLQLATQTEDKILVINCLELILSATRFGRHICEIMVRVKGCVRTLFHFVSAKDSQPPPFPEYMDMRPVSCRALLIQLKEGQGIHAGKNGKTKTPRLRLHQLIPLMQQRHRPRKQMNPKYLEEDGVTKSIRAAAALVLRNLAETSPSARRQMKPYESSFVDIVVSDCDCSGVVAQILSFFQNEAEFS